MFMYYENSRYSYKTKVETIWFHFGVLATTTGWKFHVRILQSIFTMLLCAGTLEGSQMASTLIQTLTILRSDMKRPKLECGH